MTQITKQELLLRQKLKEDFTIYAPKCLKVRTKKGEIVPFVMNREQADLHAKLEKQLETQGKVRAIILKGRQQGMSTYIQARFFWKLTHRPGRYAFILTHENRATDNIFSITDRYYMHCPDFLKPVRDISNPKEMLFSAMDSGYAVGTAKNKDVGRSWTIQYFHGSEVAFWANAELHSKGILQSVSRDIGTEVVFESTANGVGNFYHRQWELASTGESEFMPCFYPWFWHYAYQEEPPSNIKFTQNEIDLADQYQLTPQQLYWRRLKIAELGGAGLNGDKAFQQEYPCNPVEAFQASGEDFLIRSNWVLEARKTKAESIGPLVIGVDPAAQGKDATAIIRRRGRKAYNLQYFHKLDPMQVVGKLVQIIIEEKPEKMFIDVGGLGAGIVSRLQELGYHETCEAVNFGSRALDENKYINKRAEMWSLMSLWFQEPPVQIPDVDNLHADLVNIQCQPDSNNRLRLEPKDTARKRIGRSPDGGDALALTFAKPIFDTSKNKVVEQLLRYNQMTSSSFFK
ncbi:MAG: hypothetical protein EKK56_00875 [Flavobacteriaceae bacterium]|nr:MAG: hypothetical protein EKK56_00875 [Flavobacteriaceae bacterium]